MTSTVLFAGPGCGQRLGLAAAPTLWISGVPCVLQNRARQGALKPVGFRALLARFKTRWLVEVKASGGEMPVTTGRRQRMDPRKS
eukprot:COSAG04_NODE_13643_length_597_cov_1.453815_1_plen_84_part_10